MTQVTSKDNLTSHLSRVYVEKRNSPKTGNDYYVKVSVWNLPNGRTYEEENYIQKEAVSLIAMSEPLPSEI